MGYSYPISPWQRFYAIAAPVVFVLVIFAILGASSVFPLVSRQAVSFGMLLAALGATFARLLIAYALALVCSVPLALIVNRSPVAERLLLPIFDIVQSVPVLAFFPVIIIFFVRMGFTDGAAVFVLFLGMLWNIVFSLVGGLKIIPEDIKSAAHVFNVRGGAYLRRILLPGVVPYLVTGSLLAWAQGWNIIIVAEVLHTYIPGGTAAQDLFGMGSVLVNAAANGQNALFLAATLVMVVAIAILNFFVWQKLLHYAERYKFE